MDQRLDAFIEGNFKKGGRLVPARLQAALALIERLRDFPSLKIGSHLTSSGNAGLQSHETYGSRAFKRLNLRVLNKNHGRRSSNLPTWGQPLLDLIGQMGFSGQEPTRDETLLDEVQADFAAVFRELVERDPISVRVQSRTAQSVLRDVLAQAEEIGKAGDIAQYLVGAKLMVRLDIEVAADPVNKADRKSAADVNAKLGDFHIGDAVIEVALGFPDDAHLEKIETVIEDESKEVWLLTRFDRVAAWTTEIEKRLGVDSRRIVVMAVDAFIGQNMSELAAFAARRQIEQLKELFELYNTRWVPCVGTPGMRIEIK